MEDKFIFEMETPAPSVGSKLNLDDSYVCNTCPYPIEILKINDKENTITFKCLNPKEKGTEKTIHIREYIDSIKKYTYLYSKCSLCGKEQNEFKDIPIFSYCIKCDATICHVCIDKHLKTNEKNHPFSSKKFITKNNEKNVKCLLHPTEKNLAFSIKCNKHIRKECMKSNKHINHTKS